MLPYRDASSARRALSSCERSPDRRRNVERQEAVMPEPPEVAVVHRAQIRDAVFQHRDPLDPHAEGEPLVLRWVDPAIVQDLRVDHAGPENFQPVAAGADFKLATRARAADIDLGRRFGEWEIAWPKAHRQIVDIEKRAAELDQTALQVAHMGRAVDHEAF